MPKEPEAGFSVFLTACCPLPAYCISALDPAAGDEAIPDRGMAKMYSNVCCTNCF